MLIDFPIAVAAFLVGALVGMSGVGGGAVMTPALILLFGISPVVAIATDLVFATITKLIGIVIHSKFGSINWAVARKVWKGSIPGTLLGIGALVYLAGEFVLVVNFLLAFFLFATAGSMLASIGVSKITHERATIVGGGLIGFSVATTSVGAGAIGMALLRSLLGDKDPKQLVGTDLVHAIPIALIAGVSYLLAGFFDLNLVLSLLSGSLPGVVIGSFLVSKINPAIMRKLLAVVLIIAAFGVFIQGIGLL